MAALDAAFDAALDQAPSDAARIILKAKAAAMRGALGERDAVTKAAMRAAERQEAFLDTLGTIHGKAASEPDGYLGHAIVLTDLMSEKASTVGRTETETRDLVRAEVKTLAANTARALIKAGRLDEADEFLRDAGDDLVPLGEGGIATLRERIASAREDHRRLTSVRATGRRARHLKSLAETGRALPSFDDTLRGALDDDLKATLAADEARALEQFTFVDNLRHKPAAKIAQANARQPGADADLAGEMYREALETRLAAQRSLGIASPRLLTLDEAGERIEFLKSATGDALAARLGALRGAFGDLYDQAVGELAAADLDPRLTTLARLRALVGLFAGDLAAGFEGLGAGLPRDAIDAVGAAAVRHYGGGAPVASGEDTLVRLRALAIYAETGDIEGAATEAAGRLRQALGADFGDDMFTAEDPTPRDPGAIGPSKQLENSEFDKRRKFKKFDDTLQMLVRGEIPLSEAIDQLVKQIRDIFGVEETDDEESMNLGEDENTGALIDKELAITPAQRDVEEKLRELWVQGDTKLADVLDQIKKAWPHPDKRKRMEGVARSVLGGNAVRAFPLAPTEVLQRELEDAEEGTRKITDKLSGLAKEHAASHRDDESSRGGKRRKRARARTQASSRQKGRSPRREGESSLLDDVSGAVDMFIDVLGAENEDGMEGFGRAFEAANQKLELLRQELRKRGEPQSREKQ